MNETGSKGYVVIVVMKLLSGKLYLGHSVFTNIVYNSYLLAKKLLNNGTYSTGSLGVNRKNSLRNKELQAESEIYYSNCEIGAILHHNMKMKSMR